MVANEHTAPQGLASRAIGALARNIGGAMLRWQPTGALLIELPGGERVRFGSADHDQIPHLKLNNFKVLPAAMRRGTLGFAEAYIRGDIDCNDLTGLFRFFVRNHDRLERSGGRLFSVRLGDHVAHKRRHNSRQGSRRNIIEHYDLGNDFFRAWLDESMVYSSAFYAGKNPSLEQAQLAKLHAVLDALELTGDERILEIGCGWGALAREAAIRHDADVHGITLSDEQLAYAGEAASKAGLDGKCRFELRDYRDVDASYDRIMSVEMIEAVGEAYWPTFFAQIRDRLKSGGIAAIQAITIDEPRYDDYRNTPDFIQRYIFPGGMLPTPTIIAEEARAVGLDVETVVRFGTDYARTLNAWRERFEAAWPEISKQGFDEPFRRLWNYYLSYCEAGFLEGVIDVGIYRLRKP